MGLSDVTTPLTGPQQTPLQRPQLARVHVSGGSYIEPQPKEYADISKLPNQRDLWNRQ